VSTVTRPVAKPPSSGRSIGLAAVSAVPFFFVFLAMTGIVTDIQGVALLPLTGTMVKDLGLSPAQEAWTLIGLSISAAFATGLAARYADIVGHRRVLIPLLALGLAGCIICAVSGSFITLLIGRVITGLSISAPMAWAMLKVRTDADGIQTAALMNGTVISVCTPIALIMGGVLLEAGTSWTAIFWIVAGGYAIMLVMALLAEETAPEKRTRVKLDIMGAVGLTAWLVCFVIALSQAQTWGWGSAKIIILLVAGVALMGLWIGQQRRTPHALMDFKGMDKRQVASGYFSYMGVAVIASGLYIIVPAFGQTPSAVGYGFGMNVLHSSLMLIPILPATFVAGYISRSMLPRTGPRAPMALGGVLCAISFVWAAFMHSEPWMLYACVAGYGVGIVVCFNVGWALVGSAGRQDNMSITFGVQYSIAIPVGALATAVVLVILNSAKIPQIGAPTEGTYTANFLFLAGVSLVFLMANGLWFVPKKMRDFSEHSGMVGLVEPVPGAASPELPSVPAAQH
jgi:MFS family permease